MELSENDAKFLAFITKRRGIPVATLYREIAKEFFRHWKLETILQEYSSGSISLKNAWQMSGLSFPEFLYALENRQIEPPHTELMELRSEKHSKKLETKVFFRERTKRKRRTTEVVLK